MIQRHRRWLWLFVAIALLACAGCTANRPDPTPPPSRTTPSSDEPLEAFREIKDTVDVLVATAGECVTSRFIQLCEDLSSAVAARWYYYKFGRYREGAWRQIAQSKLQRYVGGSAHRSIVRQAQGWPREVVVDFSLQPQNLEIARNGQTATAVTVGGWLVSRQGHTGDLLTEEPQSRTLQFKRQPTQGGTESWQLVSLG
jgi:hypothetical protein